MSTHLETHSIDKLTIAIQDYLKAIYSLQVGGSVSTNRLAERLGVTPASVTGMVQKLAAAQPPLLVYKKHHGVELTPEGQRAALEVIRHHRLLELFLQKNLGYSWDEVHAEADRLEHVISEEFEERIAQALGDPACDPHGEPIPNRDLQVPLLSHRLLSELRPGQRANIERVEADDPQLLRFLSTLGLVPGAVLQVEDYSPFDENLRLQVEGQAEAQIVGPGITKHIFMGEVEEAA